MKGDHARTRILAEMKKILPFLVKSGNTDFGPPGAVSLPLYFISKIPSRLRWGGGKNHISLLLIIIILDNFCRLAIFKKGTYLPT